MCVCVWISASCACIFLCEKIKSFEMTKRISYENWFGFGRDPGRGYWGGGGSCQRHRSASARCVEGVQVKRSIQCQFRSSRGRIRAASPVCGLVSNVEVRKSKATGVPSAIFGPESRIDISEIGFKSVDSLPRLDLEVTTGSPSGVLPWVSWSRPGWWPKSLCNRRKGMRVLEC